MGNAARGQNPGPGQTGELKSAAGNCGTGQRRNFSGGIRV